MGRNLLGFSEIECETRSQSKVDQDPTGKSARLFRKPEQFQIDVTARSPGIPLESVWVYDFKCQMRASADSSQLSRGAAPDLWRNTLSQIPSLFGKLVYLAGLRNPNNGRYEHHGLTLLFGEDQANSALKKSHIRAFEEWLTFNLEQQKADLELYFSGLFEDRHTVLKTWVKLAPYRNLIPASAKKVERKLYVADLTAILALLKSASAAAGPDRDASRSLKPGQ
jgi:hypothetical protein